MPSIKVDFKKVFNQILDEYEKDVQSTTLQVIKQSAPKVAERLKEKSPHKYGDYSEGWKSRVYSDKYGTSYMEVYNADEWQLTHLLEYGHVLKRGGRTIGDVGAKEHIKKVQEWAEEIVFNDIKKELETL